jgi:hypothetical protein
MPLAGPLPSPPLPSQGTVSYTSDFNPAIGDTTKAWGARDFIAAATLSIPPQGVSAERAAFCEPQERPRLIPLYRPALSAKDVAMAAPSPI